VDNEAAELAAYEQLCQTYRAMDSDFGAKLLGFLPLVVGGGLTLASGTSGALSEDFLRPLSRWPEVLRVIGLNRGSSNPGGRPTRGRGHVVPSAGPTHHQRADLGSVP